MSLLDFVSLGAPGHISVSGVLVAGVISSTAAGDLVRS